MLRGGSGSGQRLDADRRRLELGRAGDRVDGVDRQQVRSPPLPGKWKVMKVEPGAQRRVDVDRRLETAAPRHDTHQVAVRDREARGVLGREIERLAAPGR